MIWRSVRNYRDALPAIAAGLVVVLVASDGAPVRCAAFPGLTPQGTDICIRLEDRSLGEPRGRIDVKLYRCRCFFCKPFALKAFRGTHERPARIRLAFMRIFTHPLRSPGRTVGAPLRPTSS
jgi:hypothetical protein